MKEIQLTVKTSILEAKEDLDKYVNETIDDKLKILLASATGTYKTSYAVQLVKEKGDRNYFVIMEPQISISGQLSQRLTEEGIQVFMYNGKTRHDIDWWINQNHIDGPFCIVSTIDSAWRLFEEGIVDPDNTIVIADEFHSFLQNARDYFDKTVTTILNSGCPVIGLTATESSWVSEKLFNIDTIVRIEATDLPPKVIQPYIVSYGLAPFVAELIEGNEWKKVVIWTTNKFDQKRIQAEMKIMLPHLNVVVMNADTREVLEKDNWDHIKENAELPPKVDAFIGNGVMQAGISLLDNDIDAVILAGQFEPLGFQQYLGRCRNFTGTFYYAHLDYGKDEIAWKGVEKQEEFTDSVEKFYNQFPEDEIAEYIDINPLFGKYCSYDDENGFTLNRCMIANEFYNTFKELHGKHMLDFVGHHDPSLIILDYNEDPVHGTTSIPKAQKAYYRNIKKEALPDLIESNAISLNGLIKFFKRGMSHQAALNVIAKSVGNRKTAVKNNLFHLPKKRKSGLIRTIETAEKAGVGIQRLLMAATTYIDQQYDSKAIDTVMAMHNNTISKLIIAAHFFNDDYPAKKKVKEILDHFDGKVSEVKSADDWKYGIKSQINGYSNQLVNFLGSDEFAKTVYNSCFITKREKEKVDGKEKNLQKLVKVVRNYSDYLTAKGLDEMFN